MIGIWDAFHLSLPAAFAYLVGNDLLLDRPRIQKDEPMAFDGIEAINDLGQPETSGLPFK